MTTGIRRSLPSLSWVALCIGLSGLLVYGYLAVAARALPSAEYAWFGAYWSLTLVVGFGLCFPLEVEGARLVHLRGADGRLPPGTVRAALALTGLGTAAVVLSWPALSGALGDRAGLAVALVVVCGASAVQFVVRGLLLGAGRVGLHGVVLLLDGGVRVLLALAVVLLVDEPAAEHFGWALAVAVLVVHVPVLVHLIRRRPRAPRPPDGVAGGVRLRTIGQVLVGSLCAQALLNAAPVLVTGAAGPAEAATAAAFVASFTLVRLPLFVAVPLQTALLPALTTVGTASARGEQRRLTVTLAGVIAAAAGPVALLAALAGPPLVGLVFGSRYALPASSFALLAAGAVVHLGLLVASQALIASARHLASASAWVVGLAVATGVFAVVPDLLLRAGWAFTAGSAVALAWSCFALIRGPRGESSAPARQHGAR